MFTFRKAGLLCAALAMFSIAGGHWAVLQTVAWVGMLADYTRDSGSLVVGVGQTFDGEHPCALCKELTIAKGREKAPAKGSSQGVPDQKSKAGKGDGVLTDNGFEPRLTTGSVRWFAPVREALNPGGEQPPVPPPRARAA